VGLDDAFTGPELDRSVWLPHYLPHWSSRVASAATYEVGEQGLRLRIPPEQGLWCADRHGVPMRVSCLQSGEFAGPVGSTVGQQPFADGLTVTEEQPTFRGHTPLYGTLAVTMRATITRRSMVAFWLSGFEDRPERSGEICVAEIFGDQLHGDVTEVGMGVHRFRDPRLREEFATEPLHIDPAVEHTYAVDWRPGSLSFAVDGETVRRHDQAPDYPVQLMLGVFDFPDKDPDESVPVGSVPELIVTRVRSSAG
jgi:hypothetical protein